MDSTQRRMIGVAVAVCAFAVGMAGLLNYFKYRATSARIIEQRLTFTGKSIESSIQSSLSLGLQFGDLATLPAMDSALVIGNAKYTTGGIWTEKKNAKGQRSGWILFEPNAVPVCTFPRP